jgi:AbrB family looped-hinge helix DNA binding protein
MRISAKGQITIPIELREALGFLPDTEVEFERAGDSVRIRKARRKLRRGNAIVAHLRGRGSVRLSTDQIMALTRAER